MILFFDTETTGLRDYRQPTFLPRALQLGALLADERGNTLGEMNVLLYPEGFTTIPLEASKVHGLNMYKVEKYGVDRSAALRMFFEMMDCATTLVAHNIEYDLDIINIELDAQREPGEVSLWRERLTEIEKFCTMQQSRDVLKLPLSDKQAAFFRDKGITQKFKNPRLIEAYTHYFGRDFEGAHDAMADVRACRDVFFKLKEDKEKAVVEV